MISNSMRNLDREPSVPISYLSHLLILIGWKIMNENERKLFRKVKGQIGWTRIFKVTTRDLLVNSLTLCWFQNGAIQPNGISHFFLLRVWIEHSVSKQWRPWSVVLRRLVCRVCTVYPCPTKGTVVVIASRHYSFDRGLILSKPNTFENRCPRHKWKKVLVIFILIPSKHVKSGHYRPGPPAKSHLEMECWPSLRSIHSVEFYQIRQMLVVLRFQLSNSSVLNKKHVLSSRTKKW